ncbi:MAG: hypothetical protein M3X11_00985 [Acidobacteriota bacterium]|nr:hypothetical protein [Acidobacteriota bacterium]
MSKRVLWLSGLAIVIFVTGLSTGLAIAGKIAPRPEPKVLLDNPRVTITEMTMLPDARREGYKRPTDQIIVFLDPANYEATDAQGQRQIKQRKSGEIVWHNKGEDASLLVNKGKPYRNLVIALK